MSAYSHVVITFLCLCLTLLFLLVLIFSFHHLQGGIQGELSYVSWNRKVQNILASTSFSGTSVVWDLRRQKPVISFTDPTSRRRCSTLQWNPDVATQLIVASDDDRSPSLQVCTRACFLAPQPPLLSGCQYGLPCLTHL
jgi:WD40 repeat protein